MTNGRRFSIKLT
jgi:hypothetical protein